MRFLVMCVVIGAVALTFACGGGPPAGDEVSAEQQQTKDVFDDDFEEGEMEKEFKEGPDKELDKADFEDGETPDKTQE